MGAQKKTGCDVCKRVTEMKIGMIHATMEAVKPLEDALRELAPKAEAVNFVNEELLREVNRLGGVQKSTLRKFGKLLFEAAESQVDGIIVACSVFCGYLPLFAEMIEVPVIAVDEAMLREAAGRGGKIGIAATTKAAAAGARKRIEENAQGRKVSIETAIITEGMDALKAGDAKRHDEIVCEACRKLAENGCGTIVLAQISMARAAAVLPPDLREKVLTSPQTGVREIVKQIIQRKGPVLGCVADDFTGASDAASFLKAAGLSTFLYNGIPETEEIRGEAAVIALKTRSVSPEEAKQDTLKAVGKLKEAGVKQIYFKYCSTFDSRPDGNIGPVCDMLLQEFGIQYTVLCPSLPVNGRTVKEGILYVNQIPLSESHMKNHPLNPMWDSSIPNLMREQSKYPCLVLGEKEMNRTDSEIRENIRLFAQGKGAFYVVPNYETDTDGERIAGIFGELPFLSGGSGLLGVLGKRAAKILGHSECAAYGDDQTAKRDKKKVLLVAGSCSAATRAQTAYYLKHGGEGILLDSERLYSGEQTVDQIWEQVQHASKNSVLVYTSSPKKDDATREAKAASIEQAMSQLACKADKDGYSCIICAGGETSGAVTKALGYRMYEIRESVAPGVPVMTPYENAGLSLVLKSGNFGQEDFFCRTIEQIEKAGQDERAERLYK